MERIIFCPLRIVHLQVSLDYRGVPTSGSLNHGRAPDVFFEKESRACRELEIHGTANSKASFVFGVLVISKPQPHYY